MNETPRESELNTKELNKILPSYLIDEVNGRKSEIDEKDNILDNGKNVSNIIIKIIYRKFQMKLSLSIKRREI